MPTLLIKFTVRLQSEYARAIDTYGPLFHRWLPDGQQDAIVINTGTTSVDLKFWFVRRGLVRRTFIEFDCDQKEVDPEIMDRQGVLDAGPLMGLLEMRGLTESELAPIVKNEIGADDYVSLGRQIVKEWIYPWTSKLINILRIRYGQYWIRELTEWDSRHESIGAYCRNLDMRWSVDNGKAWTLFMPNEQIVNLSGMVPPGKSFLDYLTRDDWKNIKEITNSDYEPSLATMVLIKAHELREQGELKHAFIEGTTALELAISDYVSQKIGEREVLLASVKRFYKLPLGEQVIVLVGQETRDVLDNLEATIKAIDIRNKIVHKGYHPSSDKKDLLIGLFKTVALLIGQDIRLPKRRPFNTLVAHTDNWEKIYER